MGYSLHKIALTRPTPGQHRIARNIVINYYNRHGFTQFEAFQEAMADPKDLDSLIPDVVFTDSTGKPVVVIEIENTKDGKQGAKLKIPELIEDCQIQEVFILDYHKGQWYRAVGSQIFSDISYSEILRIDFREYIKLD